MFKARVVSDEASAEPGELLLRPGVNLKTGETGFRSTFGAPTSLERDVLTLASAVFACDIAFKRGDAESITRKIHLPIPVENLARFQGASEAILYALYCLSHDAWDVDFRQLPGSPEAQTYQGTHNAPKVLLFSGGLDSFAAALELAQPNNTVRLISHITANQAVADAQKSLSDYLDRLFPSQFARVPFRVGGWSRPGLGFPFPSDAAREDTQRTRSFLFLALAGLAARRYGSHEIILIAENGLMAIHLPLTAARLGAFSTHTAHPEFVHTMGELLSSLLDYPIAIANPFLYMTKAEAVRRATRDHLDMVQLAVSCWRASRISGPTRHCGYCVPCLIRRIAIEANGVRLPEYQRDVMGEDIAALPADDDGKRNLVDLAEFVKSFEIGESEAAVIDKYPELVNRHIDSSKAIDMYCRFASEARVVFDSYPNLTAVVQ